MPLFKRTIGQLQKGISGEIWKGKKIVPAAEWAKNANLSEALANPDVFNVEYALSCFPDPMNQPNPPWFFGKVKRSVYDKIQEWQKDRAELVEHYQKIGKMKRVPQLPRAEVMRLVGYNPVEVMQELGLSEADLLTQAHFRQDQIAFWKAKLSK
jgi:hypothetical protein